MEKCYLEDNVPEIKIWPYFCIKWLLFSRSFYGTLYVAQLTDTKGFHHIKSVCFADSFAKCKSCRQELFISDTTLSENVYQLKNVKTIKPLFLYVISSSSSHIYWKCIWSSTNNLSSNTYLVFGLYWKPLFQFGKFTWVNFQNDQQK